MRVFNGIKTNKFLMIMIMIIKKSNRKHKQSIGNKLSFFAKNTTVLKKSSTNHKRGLKMMMKSTSVFRKSQRSRLKFQEKKCMLS